MRNPRARDVLLYYPLGPQLDYLYYTRQEPDELPNNLTRLRMKLIPLQLLSLVGGLVTKDWRLMMVSLVILMFQSLTDWVDGYIAWRFECSSELGALLDPRADKLVVLPNLMLYAIWSTYVTQDITSIVLLSTVGIAVVLDVESDLWYLRSPGGKSNLYGKIKFGIHILVAAIGIGTMTFARDEQLISGIAMACATLMLAASVCARASLNLKQRVTVEAQDMPSLIEGLARANPTSLD